MGAGFLTGKIDENTQFDATTDFRASVPRFSPEALKANMALGDLVRKVAERKGATPAQVALAWRTCSEMIERLELLAKAGTVS